MCQKRLCLWTLDLCMGASIDDHEVLVRTDLVTSTIYIEASLYTYSKAIL